MAGAVHFWRLVSRGRGNAGGGGGGSLLCGPVRKRAQFISSLVTGAAARYTHLLVCTCCRQVADRQAISAFRYRLFLFLVVYFSREYTDS